MPTSNYPGGFANGLSVRGTPMLNTYAGEVFWVYNGTALGKGVKNGSDGNRGTFNAPFATLDYAFSQCTAGRGDTILIKPGHSETITGAAGIAHDVADVAVVGMGTGSGRPTFLMDGGTAVSYGITANNAYVSNLLFKAGHSDVVTCFDVQIATDAWIDNCEFADNTTDEDFLSCIQSGTSTDNQCDGLKVTNCTWYSNDAGSLEFIGVTGNLERFTVLHNTVITIATGLASLINVVAGDSVFMADIGWNKFINRDAAGAIMLLITDQADNSGMVYNNYMASLDVADELVLTATSGLFLYENRTASVGGTTGYVLPAVDS